MSTTRPFSQACENNKTVILEKLSSIVTAGDLVLEIGSGTAQHLRFFAGNLPAVIWQGSELAENQRVLAAGLEACELANILPPLILDVRNCWPAAVFNGVFSANCLHIMSADSVEDFFAGLTDRVLPGGYLCVYGPFNYQGRFTSDSNARFELWLKERNPDSGIRDQEWVCELAEQAGFKLLADHAMPANNRLIHWQKAVPC